MFASDKPDEQDFDKQWETCIHSWIRKSIDDTLRKDAWSNLHSMTVEVENIKKTFEEHSDNINDDIMSMVLGFLRSMKDEANDIKDDFVSASHPEELIVPYDSMLFIEISSFLYVLR